MMLLNGRVLKIMHDSISTEQWDEESGYKAVDQIGHQFRKSKKKIICISSSTSKSRHP